MRERRDEIGALAGALETFKQQAADKLKIEAQERERNAGAAARQRAIESLCRRVREPWCARRCSNWAMPPAQMRTTSSGLSQVSRQTNERVEVAREGFRRGLDERRKRGVGFARS